MLSQKFLFESKGLSRKIECFDDSETNGSLIISEKPDLTKNS